MCFALFFVLFFFKSGFQAKWSMTFLYHSAEHLDFNKELPQAHAPLIHDVRDVGESYT